MLFRRFVARAFALVGTAGTLVTVSACRSPTEPVERVYTLDVAATRVPCSGIIPQQCLQVRERADAPYTLLYSPISGFAYEAGYRYMLRVGELRVANPPADGASTTLRLIAVLSKTPASF